MMPRQRQSRWAYLSTAALVFMTISMVMAGQDPPQQAGPSAAQDPFDAAEKAAAGPSGKAGEKESGKKAGTEPEFVRKSLLEWQRILPRGVFEVTRLKATEPAFTGKYATGHFHGTFVCACCNAELFSSQHKFDSGTGWPSFWRPIKANAIDRAPDNSEAEPRIEVMCRRCGAHLGHVFDDAPATPTGLRYCINSLSLKLKPTEGDTARPSSTRAEAESKLKTSKSTRSRARSRPPRNKRTANPNRPESQKPTSEEPAGSRPAPAEKTGGT